MGEPRQDPEERSSTLTLRAQRYVLLAAASTVFVNIWHGTQTVKARKASVCSLNPNHEAIHRQRAGPSHCVDLQAPP